MVEATLHQQSPEITYEVKEEDVKPLFTTPQNISGNGLTARIIFPNRVNGRVRANLTWSFVRKSTLVFASATEVGPDGTAFIGGANYSVNNVVPYDGGVEIIVTIGHNSPLTLRVDYLAINP
ncbi:MAG: hypothetical protein RMZ69_19435 [Nostoc sp. ChiQUE01a]|nr:hypothetical protein [Nostoc sp. ChiQUE01a]